MDAQTLRRTKQLRDRNPLMRLPDAVRIARSEVKPDTGKYPWLDALMGHVNTVEYTNTVDPLTIKVQVVYDEDHQLGEDDVTGTFGDTWQEDAIPYTLNGTNGQGCKYYYPANSRTADGDAGLPVAKGLSKAQMAEHRRRTIEQDMVDDANRYYVGVIVTITLDDTELAETSLWGIDIIDDYDARPYLIETAIELIEEALDQAKEAAPEVLTRLRRQQANLIAVFNMTPDDE